MFKYFLIFGLIFLVNSFEVKSFHGRIVNGTDAVLGEFPYIISFKDSLDKHFCGGSIINANWILIAGHCVNFEGNKSIQHGVIAISASGPNVISVAEVIIHENYTYSPLKNDIAVLRLSESIKFDKNTQPIVLPEQDQIFNESSTAVLAGWGYNNSNGPTVEFLQKAYLRIYNTESCRAIHENPLNNNTIFDTNICAGVPGGWRGQCSGDSGGPLTVNGVQVGIVSWSIKPCATPPYPGVYTRVASYINWIKSKIE